MAEITSEARTVGEVRKLVRQFDALELDDEQPVTHARGPKLVVNLDGARYHETDSTDDGDAK